jgi:hypothetical protein
MGTGSWISTFDFSGVNWPFWRCKQHRACFVLRGRIRALRDASGAVSPKALYSTFSAGRYSAPCLSKYLGSSAGHDASERSNGFL